MPSDYLLEFCVPIWHTKAGSSRLNGSFIIKIREKTLEEAIKSGWAIVKTVIPEFGSSDAAVKEIELMKANKIQPM